MNPPLLAGRPETDVEPAPVICYPTKRNNDIQQYHASPLPEVGLPMKTNTGGAWGSRGKVVVCLKSVPRRPSGIQHGYSTAVCPIVVG